MLGEQIHLSEWLQSLGIADLINEVYRPQQQPAFDRVVVATRALPQKKTCCAALQVILESEAVGPDVDVETVAGATEGYSGSDLRQLCVTAAMRPVRLAYPLAGLHTRADSAAPHRDADSITSTLARTGMKPVKQLTVCQSC